MNIAEAIKKCALDAFDAKIPCDAVFGVVESQNPLAIRVGECLLTDELIELGEHLLKKEETITMGEYARKLVINPGVNKGDTLLLIRKSGGEKYIGIAVTDRS